MNKENTQGICNITSGFLTTFTKDWIHLHTHIFHFIPWFQTHCLNSLIRSGINSLHDVTTTVSLPSCKHCLPNKPWNPPVRNLESQHQAWSTHRRKMQPGHRRWTYSLPGCWHFLCHTFPTRLWQRKLGQLGACHHQHLVDHGWIYWKVCSLCQECILSLCEHHSVQPKFKLCGCFSWCV
jgi:hypothetical protein